MSPRTTAANSCPTASGSSGRGTPRTADLGPRLHLIYVRSRPPPRSEGNMPFLWLKYRRPAALVLSAACKETQYPPFSKGPPSHPSSSPRRSPLPQPLQHPLHALLPPHQPPSPVAHDPPSAPTHFRRTAHAVSAPPPPRPGPPLPRPRFKIKGPPALALPPSRSTCPHFEHSRHRRLRTSHFPACLRAFPWLREAPAAVPRSSSPRSKPP